MKVADELGLDTPIEDLFHETVLNIIRTASALASVGARLFRKFSLTEAQFNVLMVLKYSARPLTQSDMGRRLVITRASVTSVLDRLEQKRFVARRDVPGNRRVNHIELTAAGRALVDRVEPEYRAALQEVLRGLDPITCKELNQRLETVRDNARSLGATTQAD